MNFDESTSETSDTVIDLRVSLPDVSSICLGDGVEDAATESSFIGRHSQSYLFVCLSDHANSKQNRGRRRGSGGKKMANGKIIQNIAHLAHISQLLANKSAYHAERHHRRS